jgi:hypothetical protein
MYVIASWIQFVFQRYKRLVPPLHVLWNLHMSVSPPGEALR